MGRRSIDEMNKIRAANGLSVIPKKTRESRAILPESKKKRNQEILATMLSKKGQSVVTKVLDKALDDDDPDQLACLKIVMDRVLPSDYLAKNKGKSSAIQINISGVGQEVNSRTIDAETFEIEEDDG